MKLNSKLLNEFINILLSAKWLTMIIKHTNAFKPLLGAKPADSAKEIDGLMSHGQVCTLLEKYFESGPFIGLAILLDPFVQCNVRYRVKLDHPLNTDFKLRSDKARATLRACHIWAMRDRKAGSNGICCRTDGKQSLHNRTRFYSMHRLRSIGDIAGPGVAMTWRA